MEIKVVYSKIQLESTVDFIATHNPSFLGQHDVIRKSIMSTIQSIISKYPDIIWSGTMGYYVWISMEELEGIDSDENILRVEFMVEPAVGKYGLFDQKNEIEEIYHKKL